MSDYIVLVCYGERKRPVKLNSPTFSELKKNVLVEFADVLPPVSEHNLSFQVKEES